MIPVLTRAQMREFDRYAIESCHVPGVVLMENAGRGAADVLSAMIEARRRASPAATPGSLDRPASRRAEPVALSARVRSFPVRHVASPGQPANYPLEARVVVVCGTGNNGGDGFVVARHLLARGAEVEVYLAGRSEKVTGDARINHDAYIDLGGLFFEMPEGESLAPLQIALSRADFVIDALFGTGLDRPITGHLADVIAVINEASCRCVALDIPSGLDADSGAPFGVAIEADDTVTFGHLKIGMLTPEGARLSGNVHVVDLGVPDPPILAHVGHVAEVMRRQTIGSYFAAREASVHKHKAGDVLVVAGSPGKLGASLLTARAAMRSGAGLVTICTWPDAATSLESRVVEVMTARIDPANLTGSLDAALAGRRTVAIGPGFGLGPEARAAVDHVVLGWDGLKVVDADAITHFVGRPEALAQARGQLILTPHPGELGRLLGRSAAAIEQDRFGAVREAVELTRATVILKGARTIVATPDGRLFICMAGNPALATAGSGDVLTGTIAAFACSMPADEAACAGVFTHALAADLWRNRTGCDRGLFAGEIAEIYPEIIAALASGNDPLAAPR
ncbi:NAD(P)H-hydrate dehydratase [Polyangium aurulentum]|uniref:NAD(P)H-hydrate dehydratase n=1 Tax=Polyangium aurulentum TaxID=2567896 RepID=UPI0010AEDFBB|nr:NAD(P)H-hydrate dehydratase [Polyangium aurulentum]UQA59671.1 NAD(P)H-hydrate dehydratase [Polyangium aurulentum]